MAFKDTPKDLVKGKNLGKAINSYDYKYGDTIIIGSIGGNKSFNARKKYQRTDSVFINGQFEPKVVGSIPGEAEFFEGLTPSTTSQALELLGITHDADASLYDLEQLIQDEESSFEEFCEILLQLKQKGVNIIIFGLPFGGKESRKTEFTLIMFNL